MSNVHLDTSAWRVPARADGREAGPADMPPVLRLLAHGAPVAGPELARRLGLARAAIRKQVETLRRAGLEIDAGPHGYQLARPLDLLDATQVRAGLPAAWEPRVGHLENHWQLDSTSSEVARRAAILPDLSCVFADWQRAGRGRRGRSWRSPPACNLQFSCLKRFTGSYAALAGLSLAVGIALVRGLEDCGFDGLALKWPNDLVHGDAKLGGILVELGGDSMGPCHAIIGIGVNVHLPETLRRGLGQPGTDLAERCAGAPPSRNALATALIARLAVQLDAFDRTGFPACAEEWARLDALAGRGIRVEAARGGFEGVAAGVDARGALQVRTGVGLRSVDSGEITVRPV